MNWDRIAGRLKQHKGVAMQKWGRLTGDRVCAVAGRCEQLAGKLMEWRGISRDAAKKQHAAPLAGQTWDAPGHRSPAATKN